nr:AraC family transcriptional regulator [Blautia marasmi]
MQILAYRNHAIEELTKRVCELKTKRHTSSYTEQCKDYVKKHFKEKVYLDDIAGKLGISSSYLSRIFKRETGICIQDYVNDIRIERAANLLIYSEESIPRIAEYVNFPSQSYFGKIFKAKKNMTPRQYRESYKPTEFLEEK